MSTDTTDQTEQQRIDGNTAGAISTLAQRISNWAERKGFHEPEKNAEALDHMAQLLETSHSLGKATFMSRPVNGEEKMYTFSEFLRLVAAEHRTLHLGMKLALMHSELSEALETLRDTGADNLSANWHEELADAMIRIMDIGAMTGGNLGDEIIDKMVVNEDRPYKHGRVA